MITRRKLLKLTLASLVLPALRSPGASAACVYPRAARAALYGPERPCPTLVLDAALANDSHPWTREDPRLLNGMRAAAPPAIGYPGHWLSDYWDWNTGWLDVSRLSGVMNLPQHISRLLRKTGCVDLNELQAACAATGAPVLFTANLLTRNPRLNSSSAGDPIQDAREGKTFLLQGLAACAARGISPRWLALGDSLAGEQPWYASPASRVFRGDLASGVTDFPQVAADWAASARKDHPNLAIAAFATGSLTTDEATVRQWNARLVEQLAGQNSIRALAAPLALLGGMGVSAKTLPGWGDAAEQKQQYALLKDPLALRALFSLPAAALKCWLDQSLGGRGTLRLWLNALYLADPIGALRFTWAHGLLMANAIQAVLREPVIDLAVLENTADDYNGAFFTNKLIFNSLALEPADGVDTSLLIESLVTGERTALGHVFGLFFDAMRGAPTARPLALDAPGDALVWGWAFFQEPSRPKRMLLGNLSETDARLDLSAAWAEARGTLEGTTYRAAPCEYILRAGRQAGAPFTLLASSAKPQADGSLVLPPYSLTLLDHQRAQNPAYLPGIQK